MIVTVIVLTMIYVDSREKGMIDKVKERLKKKNIKNVDIEVKALDAGDFLVILDDNSKYLFERKTLIDFQNSVMEKRLWNQLYKLQKKLDDNEVDRICLAITNFYFTKHTKSSIIYGALGSVYRRFPIDVVFFRSNTQFLDFMFKICSKPKSKLGVKPEFVIQPLIGSLDNINEVEINVKSHKKSKQKDYTVKTKKFPINIRFR